jgi:PKD repeat protein
MQPSNQIRIRESAASEVIGAVLLISVVVTAITIIGVALLSQPAPEKIPALDAIISSTDHKIFITHNGGDPLQKNEVSILVDGVKLTDSFTQMNGNEWSSWAIGDTLVYQVPAGEPDPSSIQLVYTYGSSGYVLQSWGSVLSSIPVTPLTTVETPDTPEIHELHAEFSGNPTSGYPNLNVQFTDQSYGSLVDTYSWDFGDGASSSLPNPSHTYGTSASYPVTLTVTNTTYSLSSTNTKGSFIQVLPVSAFITDENVFVYGTKLKFMGNTINGEDATILVMGPLSYTELDGGAKIYVTTIYVNGPVDLDGAAITLGSSTKPGHTYITGDLTTASSYLYGEVNVSGNKAQITSSTYIYGNLSVDGNVEILYGSPHLMGADSHIYYTGTLTKPSWITVDDPRWVQVPSLPEVIIPDIPIPSPQSEDWYSDEYDFRSSGGLSTGARIYSSSYYTTPAITASNVIIVAANGDITLSDGGGKTITGVLFAPKGQVTLSGLSRFEGVVIARDGLYVEGGGNIVTFKNINEYISDPDNYPFL